MASLTLKNVPEDVLDGLREAAEEDRRSLNQQVVVLLDEALRRRRERISLGVANQVRQWESLAGAWRSDVSGVAERRAVYKRRTKGRKVKL